MRQLLIATSNQAKLTEIKNFLGEVPFNVVSLRDLNIRADAPETGETFEENAIMKARYYYQKSGLTTLADDGGFEIDALNGEPGVHSHRWVRPDREATDEELIAYTIERMKDVPETERGAQLHLVLALVIPEGKQFTAEAAVRGIVPLKPGEHRTPGFPYRSLLFLPEIGKFYDHAFLTDEENSRYNHRGKAVGKIKEWLMNNV